MRANHRTVIALAALALIGPGCQNAARRKVVENEPVLTDPAESGTLIGDASVPSKVAVVPPASVSVVDRHPLLSRPRDYYESSGNNKFVKTAAAAVVGVPAGIVGELRQIVTGTPVARTTPVVTPTDY
ncbi:hypothetical protein TA3x_002377 [Tundrisphaera sp. TA3]|uniref:hypothetical protein n=1 Tax=Tundrisphaera sp. TA3 TaxID=3435775 RepID=UPI003EB81059